MQRISTFQTRRVVRQLNPRLVETRDRGDKAEPQPLPGVQRLRSSR